MGKLLGVALITSKIHMTNRVMKKKVQAWGVFFKNPQSKKKRGRPVGGNNWSPNWTYMTKKAADNAVDGYPTRYVVPITVTYEI